VEDYLGVPFFSGLVPEISPGKAGVGDRVFELEAGAYFFAQVRGALTRDECAALAIEVQREILWQRLAPRKLLCIRQLFEDGKTVTQALRSFGVSSAAGEQ
jgi:hypothetical protein